MLHFSYISEFAPGFIAEREPDAALPLSRAAVADRGRVTLAGVGKTYAGATGPVTALAGISLDIQPGEIFAIIGRSGAGKSTLIRTINRLETPSAGSVTVSGQSVTDLAERELPALRRRIGMIFQHFNLLARRTAFENVALPLEIAGVARAEIRRRVDPLLELVGLGDKRDRYPAELSGGQKQRVGIARALATEPRVLLSDEATSALDPETTAQILTLLRQVNAALKVTILLITHEMTVIKAVADQVAVIDGGRIVEQGATFDVFARPRHSTTRSFLSGLTAGAVPALLADRLQAVPEPGSQALVRIVFTGAHATDPVISWLTKRLGIEVNIVQAQVDDIAGRPFGVILVTVPGDAATLAAVRAEVTALQLHVEVLGHVR